MQMGPLRLLFLARTSAPAQFLFEETERFFDLLTVRVMGFDCPRGECQIVRPPVAAAVFDHHDRMGHAASFSPRMPVAMRPRSPEGVLTKLAVTLEPHHIPSASAVEESGRASQLGAAQ